MIFLVSTTVFDAHRRVVSHRRKCLEDFQMLPKGEVACRTQQLPVTNKTVLKLLWLEDAFGDKHQKVQTLKAN